jgi:N-acetylmuramoyl-L-alanine amidase
MYPRRGILWLLGCGVLLKTAPLWAATQLRQATLRAPAGDGAQLVLDLSAAPGKPKVFTLSNPERLVIDLPNTGAARGLRLPAPAGPVTELRQGPRGNALRVVLQLKQGLPWQQRIEGQKLIIDMGRVPAAVAAAAEPPAAPKPVRAEHAPADAGRDVIVAIDAGHGGEDPGAVGRGGTREKVVVLAIAQALAKRINAEQGMKAMLTRSDDRRIELRERFAKARRAGADLFISVHADANTRSNVTGSSVYVLNEHGASSEAAQLLAQRENAAELKGGISLGDKDRRIASVLMDLSQGATVDHSSRAAERVLAQLDRVGTVRKTQVQSANFAVLKAPDIPSILVETAFISNPAEERKLASASHQQALADAMHRGVLEYFRENPPDGTWFSRQREQQRLVASSPASQ